MNEHFQVQKSLLKLGFLIYPGFLRQWETWFFKGRKNWKINKNKKYLVGAAVGGVALVVLSDPAPPLYHNTFYLIETLSLA